MAEPESTHDIAEAAKKEPGATGTPQPPATPVGDGRAEPEVRRPEPKQVMPDGR